jgi:hypothetical protein
MMEDDPEEATGVVDDGIALRPAEDRPVFLRVSVVDGVLARTRAGEDHPAAYPIARGKVLRAVARTSIVDPDLKMPVRWYRVNAVRRADDAVYKRGAGGGDCRRGGWIRSMRRTVGMTEVPALASVGINHWSTAGLGYLQTPLPRSDRTRFP